MIRFSKVKSLWLTSRIFNFNQVERDRWVKKQASMIQPGSSVLDVGSGSCPYAKYFAHCEYSTQDFAALESDQLRGKHGYGQLNYVCDATAIPVKDGAFDAVLCTEVLEHVPEPIKVIQEMSRILKPGGKLILTAPLGSGLHQEPFHFYGGYTPYWYDRYLTESGFADVIIEPNAGFFKYYGQESIRFARLLSAAVRSNKSAKTLAVLPFWLVSFPWFVLILPTLCHWLDSLDREKKFTIGYHVLALKGPARSS